MIENSMEQQWTVAAAMVRVAFECGMAIGGGGDISDALFDAEDNLAENFGEIDTSTSDGRFWAARLEETEQYIVDECKKIIMANSKCCEEPACCAASCYSGELSQEEMSCDEYEFIDDVVMEIADSFQAIADIASDTALTLIEKLIDKNEDR